MGMTMGKLFTLVFALAFLSGCASTRPNLSDAELNAKLAAISAKALTTPTHPRHGEVIWGSLKVGMSVQEVLNAVPGSFFNDEWTSLGAVGAMGEAGVFAKNKVLVTGDITGPFGGPSSFFGLFDGGGRLDGIAILTLKKGLSPEINGLYGSIGFNLAEFKEAAKLVLKSAPPELGKRIGPPRFGKSKWTAWAPSGLPRLWAATKRLA